MTKYVDIDEEVVATTDLAVGVGDPGGMVLVWIPRSVIEDDYVYPGIGDTVRVAEWFALKEGLI